MKKFLKWGAIAFGALMLLTLLLPREEVAQPAASTAAVAETEPNSPAEPPPAEARAPEWTEVATLSGNTAKVGDTFTLTGAPARLRWTLGGDEFSSLAVYVLPEGEILEETGGFPEVMPDAPGSDVTRLRKTEGQYYLNVNGAGDWSVVVEEER